MKKLWMAMVALAFVAQGSAAQTVQDGGLELDFTGRMQIQLNTTSVNEDDLGPGNAPPALTLETRRVRFGTNFDYDGWITGKVEVDFGGATASLTDGYIDAAISDAVSVRMGQFKKPFGSYELTSNTQIPTIERTARIRGLDDLVGLPAEAHLLLDEGGFLGRNIGVMVHGSAGAVGYSAGVFNGEGTNTRETMVSKAYAGRVTYDVGSALTVAGAVSMQPTGVMDAGGDEISATAFAVDAQWGGFRQEGLRVLAEAYTGQNALIIVGDEPASMIGVHAAASWFTPSEGGRIEGWEPVVRLSWADPDTDISDDEGLLAVTGVNLYFQGRNRLMLNGEAYMPPGGLDMEYGIRTQFQIYF